MKDQNLSPENALEQAVTEFSDMLSGGNDYLKTNMMDSVGDKVKIVGSEI